MGAVGCPRECTSSGMPGSKAVENHDDTLVFSYDNLLFSGVVCLLTGSGIDSSVKRRRSFWFFVPIKNCVPSQVHSLSVLGRWLWCGRGFSGSSRHDESDC